MFRLTYGKDKALAVVAGLLSLACLLALAYRTFQAQVHFDAAYNFLAYKNLVDTGSFVHSYGSDSVAFNPIISTGPTVNLPIAAFYSLTSEIEGIFFGTAATNTVYWIAFALFGFGLVGTGALSFFIPFVGLIFYLHPINFTEGTLLSGLGEHYAVLWVFFGFCLLIRKNNLQKLSGYLCLGFALLTKLNMLVGFALPLLVFTILLFKNGFRGAAKISLKTAATHILGLALVVLPTLAFKKVLPRVALSSGDYVTYEKIRIAWNDEVSGFAFWNATELLAYASTGAPEHLQNVKENIKAKVSELERFYGGKTSAALVLFSWPLLLIGLHRSRGQKDALVFYYLLLFGLSIGLWWFLCNKSMWYRYFAPCDLAWQICLAFGFIALVRQLITAGGRERMHVSGLSLGLLYLSAVILFSFVPQSLSFNYDGYFAEASSRKANDQRVARFAAENGKQGLFFGYGWLQSPGIRALARLEFVNMLRPVDLANAVASGRSMYFIYDPIYSNVGLGDQQVEKKAEGTIYRDGPYTMYKLDRAQLNKPF